MVSKADDLKASVKDWLAQPGTLLRVGVSPLQLVMPAFMAAASTVGMVLYAARAVLQGRGDNVWESFL